MKKAVFLLVVLLVLAGLAYREFLYRPPLRDEDCPSGTPLFTATVPIGIRHYDVAALDENGKVSRITKDHKSWDADLSPDGTRAVFVSGRDGAWSETGAFHTSSLYVMNVDGTDQTRLVPGEHLSDPSWSPDGRWIAFVDDPEGSKGGIYVVRPDGSDLRPVVVFDDAGQDAWSLTWSPDSKRLAFVWRDGEESAASLSIVDVNERITYPENVMSWKANIDNLDWSPTGDRFVFGVLGTNPTNAVYLLDMDVGDPQLIFVNGQQPSWSPDGERVVYFSGRGGEYRWAVRELDGSGRIDFGKGESFDDAFEDISWTSCTS